MFLSSSSSVYMISYSTGLFDDLEISLPPAPTPIGSFCQSSSCSSRSSSSSRKNKKISRRYRKAAEKRNKCIMEIAREAVLFNCPCKRMCLASVGTSIQDSVEVLAEYMTPWMNMPKNEHREKFLGILEGCAGAVSNGGHLETK